MTKPSDPRSSAEGAGFSAAVGRRGQADERRPLGDLTTLVSRALALAEGEGRILIGIAGSPGSGKTTLSTELVRRLNDVDHPGRAVAVPMDGFHLANRTLDALGIHARKGAIDTFDGWGFLAQLRRMLAERDHPVYAPNFQRTIDEGVAAAIVVPVDTTIVVVEGNYLLVDEEPWNRIPGLLAESWFCDTAPDDRLARLVDRHERHGRSPAAALAWARSVDGVNAMLVERSRTRADLLVSGAIPL